MLSWRIRFDMLLRSFAIQGSWNYRTLIGTGFAYALIPALRSLHPDRAGLDQAVARHTGVFNSHPYLVGVALGAVSRLEAERVDPHVVDRFKAAVRSSLGSLGDGLIWAGWRPTCALLGLALVFGGLPWWAGPLVFLLSYNAGHLVLRVWGFHVGFRHGREVGEVLRKAHLDHVHKDVARVGAFLLGAVLPLLLFHGAGSPSSGLWIAAGVGVTILGLRFGNASRTPILAGVAAVLFVGLLLGLMP